MYSPFKSLLINLCLIFIQWALGPKVLLLLQVTYLSMFIRVNVLYDILWTRQLLERPNKAFIISAIGQTTTPRILAFQISSDCSCQFWATVSWLGSGQWCGLSCSLQLVHTSQKYAAAKGWLQKDSLHSVCLWLGLHFLFQVVWCYI